MRIETRLMLLSRIEELIVLADAEEEHEVAIWLDRARVAAGGEGDLRDDQFDLVARAVGEREAPVGDRPINVRCLPPS